MKPTSLVVCGIMVSLSALAAYAQSNQPQQGHQNRPPAHVTLPAHDPHGLADANRGVPRGDLRGDIASNARIRNAPPPPAQTHH